MTRHRSPARWLAPLALVACTFAVYTVVDAGLTSDEPSRPAKKAAPASNAARAEGARPKGSSRRRPASPRRTYTVKAGDTLSGIAAATGVPLERIQELNPQLDSQSLQTGQKIKLSP